MLFKALVLLAVLLATSAEDSEEGWIEQVQVHRSSSDAEDLRPSTDSTESSWRLAETTAPAPILGAAETASIPADDSKRQIYQFAKLNEVRGNCEDGDQGCPSWAGQGACNGGTLDQLSGCRGQTPFSKFCGRNYPISKFCGISCKTCEAGGPNRGRDGNGGSNRGRDGNGCKDNDPRQCPSWAGEGACNGGILDDPAKTPISKFCALSCKTCEAGGGRGGGRGGGGYGGNGGGGGGRGGYGG